MCSGASMAKKRLCIIPRIVMCASLGCFEACHIRRNYWGKLHICYQVYRNYHLKFNSYIYSRVSFYDDSLLRPLSSWIEHSQLVVHHCRNSSVLSLLSALLALFQCACVSYFSAVLLSWLWFFHPWHPLKRQIVLFCKREWKDQGRLWL